MYNKTLISYLDYNKRKNSYTDDEAKNQLKKFKVENNKVHINNKNYKITPALTKTLKDSLFKSQFQRVSNRQLQELIKEKRAQTQLLQDNYNKIKQVYRDARKIKLISDKLNEQDFEVSVKSLLKNRLHKITISKIKPFFEKSIAPICSPDVRKIVKDIMTTSKRKFKVNGTIHTLFFDVKNIQEDGLDDASKLLLKILNEKHMENTYENKKIASKIAKNLILNKYSNLTAEELDQLPEFSIYYHHLKSFQILNPTDINQFSTAMAEDIFTMLLNRSNLKGSGFVFVKVLKTDIKMSLYDPLKGSGFIEIPQHIKDKKACINIKNEDKYCFRYCVECFMNKTFEQVHPERMYHYKKGKQFLPTQQNYEGVNFPASIEDIKTFEQNNPEIGVNVFELRKNDEQKSVVDILKKSGNLKAENQVDILYIEKDGNSHYVLIRSIDRLLASQLNGMKTKQHICKYCFKNYYSEEKFNSSRCKTGDCTTDENQPYVMPQEGEKVHFGKNGNDFLKLLKCPFYVVLDFEAFPEKYDDKNITDKTIKYQKHKPCSFCLKVISPYERFDEPPIIYTMKDENDDVMKKFFEELKKLERRLLKVLYTEHQPLKMRPYEIDDFKYATHCKYCKNEFTEQNVKCRDHDHITGRYRAASCSTCNTCLKQKSFKIPIFCHNFKGYDSHFIIAKADEYNFKEINVIASSSEKFLQLSLDKLDFKDSFSFLQCSLEKAINLNKYLEVPKTSVDYDKIDGEKKFKKLPNWKKNFAYMVKYAPKLFKEKFDITITDEMLDLLTEKGVYPYSYMNCFERLGEGLPARDKFYNDLTLENISNEDYNRAQRVYELFQCKSMRDYHDIYLLMDVLLLGDVFENFRNEMINHTGLDPCQFISMSHYAWNSQLRMTNCKLGLIYHQADFDTIERGKRGGITQVNKKYCKAFNKYLNNLQEKPSSQEMANFLLYLDAVNLYGKAMSMNLPYDNYEKLQQPATEEDILSYDFENDPYGYFDVVKLHYPKHLHKLHQDLPLAPVKKLVKADELSEYQKELYRKTHKKEATDEKVSKLCLTLEDKDNYVVHRAVLKFYLEQGLVLEKVYETHRFNQKPFLKDYIDKNTEARNKRSDDFGKALYKLLNNAVFGKTMEDIKNRINLDLVKDENRYEKLVRDPKFKDVIDINEDLVAVLRAKDDICLDKPMAIGVAILDLSKLIMYKMFYEVLKPFYGEKVELLYMDTDSFILNFYTDDLYEDMKDEKLKPHFHNKELGKFKNELGENHMSEFVALSPKMYSYTYNEKAEFRAKGVPKSIVKKTFAFDIYKNCLFNEKCEPVKFNTIQSKKHQIYTLEMNKMGLSPYESKRYWINSIESKPYGFQGD